MNTQERVSSLFVNNQLHHALLLVGKNCDEQKQQFLNFIGQLLVCPNIEDEKPCTTCVNCQQVVSHLHPDIVWVGNSSGATKDQLVTTLETMSKSPLVSKNKLYVIENVNNMSVAAQNSWLKFLEEPPTNVYCVATVDNDSQLLPTINSRFYKIFLNNGSKIYDQNLQHTVENLVSLIKQEAPLSNLLNMYEKEILAKVDEDFWPCLQKEITKQLVKTPWLIENISEGQKMSASNVNIDHAILWLILKGSEFNAV